MCMTFTKEHFDSRKSVVFKVEMEYIFCIYYKNKSQRHNVRRRQVDGVCEA